MDAQHPRVPSRDGLDQGGERTLADAALAFEKRHLDAAGRHRGGRRAAQALDFRCAADELLRGYGPAGCERTVVLRHRRNRGSTR